MTCYACGRPAGRRCDRCRRAFCFSHGRERCDRCTNPERAVPSGLLYRGALLLMVFSLSLGAWHLLVWPQFPAPPLSASSLLTRREPATAPAAGEGTPAAEPAVTPTPAASLTPAPAQRRYTVESGDTLLAIAERHGVDMDEIIQANNLADPAALSLGQELVIP